MAFQDFDVIQQRRENERKQKLKKRITIGIVSSIVLVGMVGAVVCAFVQYGNGASKGNKSPGSRGTPVVTAEKAVKSMCIPTEFKQTCESSLSKAIESKVATTTQPKDLFKALMVVAANEVGKAIDQLKTLKFETPEKKAAFDDCMTLLGDAQEELNASVSLVDKKDFKGIYDLKPDINNHLSAVLSYQETCIDGIPDGEEKVAVGKALVTPKELSSISLSIVSAISSILKVFGGAAYGKRNLLSTKEDELPSWISNEERRILKADTPSHAPNVVVAKDGSGNFTTVNEALAAMPPQYEGRYVIYVKEGVYEENVIITKKMVNVTVFGDGSQKSIITGTKNFADGVPTYQTATFAAIGEGFMAQSIGFRNTAGADKLQAVALRVQSDRSIFLNCRIEGFQSALYAQTHRQLYRSSYITGTIDIIFGDASAVFQNCLIYVRKPMENQQNTVTSQGRVDKNEDTGFVIQNSRILPEDKLEPEKATIKSYLGRPSKLYSRTIIMETEIADFISPEGWLPYNGDFALNTLYYAEYNNKGTGAPVEGRVKWAGLKMIKKEEALQFTLSRFLQGELWLKDRDVPVRYTLFT
ncbi:esterase [Lithospermum erythrorhizon]|uniref:Pectinesterase n=1 Tax=Lithospermum erythrorhizon TaxID=34254 RepID=A0AAV3QUS5_LITER